MSDVVGEHTPQVRPTEEEEPVEALTSDGADPPLGIGVGDEGEDLDLEDLGVFAEKTTASKVAVTLVPRSRIKNRKSLLPKR